MARKRGILQRMRDNPQDDWTIRDVEKLCNDVGLEIRKPSHGSHYIVSSAYLRDSITVPFKRPIKSFYIKMLVSFADGHKEGKKHD